MIADGGTPSRMEQGASFSFDEFFLAVEPRLRRALVATYGVDEGCEAAAEALAWAWEHRDRAVRFDRPVGYLFRVAQSHRRRRRIPVLRPRTEWSEPWVEPGLAGALTGLSQRQRIAVVLVHGYAWTSVEVAELLDITPATVQTHLKRGMTRLEKALGADRDT